MATRQVHLHHREATAAQEIQTLLEVAVAHQPLVQMRLPLEAGMAVMALHLLLVEAVLPMLVVGAAEPKVVALVAVAAAPAAAEMAQLALHIQQPNLELQTQAAAVAVLRM
jgi:hypothetical protein